MTQCVSRQIGRNGMWAPGREEDGGEEDEGKDGKDAATAMQVAIASGELDLSEVHSPKKGRELPFADDEADDEADRNQKEALRVLLGEGSAHGSEELLDKSPRLRELCELAVDSNLHAEPEPRRRTWHRRKGAVSAAEEREREERQAQRRRALIRQAQVERKQLLQEQSEEERLRIQAIASHPSLKN